MRLAFDIQSWFSPDMLGQMGWYRQECSSSLAFSLLLEVAVPPFLQNRIFAAAGICPDLGQRSTTLRYVTALNAV